MIGLLTLRGKRMGNHENIPGECVSGFIPATNMDDIKMNIYVQFYKDFFFIKTTY